MQHFGYVGGDAPLGYAGGGSPPATGHNKISYRYVCNEILCIFVRIMQEKSLSKIVAHSKQYGFVFQSSEIYEGGLGAIYDYGPLGVLLKRNISESWWKEMVQFHENIVGLDAAILMHPRVWHASGHVDAFHDPLIDNKDSKKRYRVDTLIEDYIQKLRNKAEKDAKKKAKKQGWELGGAEYTDYLQKSRYGKKAEEVSLRLSEALASGDLQALKKIIDDYGIADPETGSKNWTDVRQFQLMFKTQLGALEGMDIYLRPETAQGIFVNFLNVQKAMRLSLPFGIAQIGKAFRNEIVARQFIFRMREFEQMEMQFFVRPGEELKWFEYWKERRLEWYLKLGISKDFLRFHDHDKLAHYANAATDIEYRFPFGFKEVEGVHSRTDFDLARHQEFSGKKLQYFDTELQKSYVPYVIETSTGLDRLFLLFMIHSYTEEEVPSAKGKLEKRIVMKFPTVLAPIQAAVLPLLKNDTCLVEKARALYESLKYDFYVHYEEKDSIGRRYRRQDAWGTPFCLTIDHQTLEDGTLTLRDRDTLQQERFPMEKIKEILKEKFGI